MTDTAATADDYQAMKAFLRFFSQRFLDQRIAEAGQRPMALLAQQEQESAARATSGLRMAVNNCLEISAPWPLSQIVSLDSEMHGQGLLTLSQVRRQVWGRYSAVLKRGLVRNEQELSMVQAMLADPAMAQGLPAPDRQTLQGIASAYRPQRAAAPERTRPIRPGASAARFRR